MGISKMPSIPPIAHAHTHQLPHLHFNMHARAHTACMCVRSMCMPVRMHAHPHGVPLHAHYALRAYTLFHVFSHSQKKSCFPFRERFLSWTSCLSLSQTMEHFHFCFPPCVRVQARGSRIGHCRCFSCATFMVIGMFEAELQHVNIF